MNVTLTVDGTTRTVDVEPRRALADVLREECGRTGVHLACEHGVCGSCTVVVDGQAVRSCLLLAVQCDGSQVRTAQGLAGPDGSAHPVQEAFSAEHALQCGYCTPGFEVLVAHAIETDPSVVDDEERLTALLASNVCRCTGYAAIRRAARRAAGRG